MGKRSREAENAHIEVNGAKKKQKKAKKTSVTATTADNDASNVPKDQHDLDAVYNSSGPVDAQCEAFLKDHAIQVENKQLEADPDSFRRPIIRFEDLHPNCRRFPVLQNFSAPTPVQAISWPYLLSRRDLIGVAETGSGKTLAFGLPLIVRLGEEKQSSRVRAVILTPTRELALQVFEQIQQLAQNTLHRAVCVYGGVDKDRQRKELKKATIIVATPGRLKDFLQEGSIKLHKVRYLVLDEADRMLDKGFEDDIKHLISHMPSDHRQTAMFTATWPKSIRDLASTFMHDPIRITIGEDRPDGELRANTRITQAVEVIDQYAKQPRLLELLKENLKSPTSKILVFCLYKKEATRIESLLHSRNLPVSGIHGDMSQPARLHSLSQFKSGSSRILVATDVAARGLDIPAVSLVINHTFPLTAEDYVHRIGRTGRAGASGRAITLFTEHDKALSGALINVLKAAKQPVPEELMAFGGTVKKKGHEVYGNFYRDTSDAKVATKIKFDD
ncbi:MAG: hypothetical protein Q9227_008487 [Pyrenula ochraceoflavens]